MHFQLLGFLIPSSLYPSRLKIVPFLLTLPTVVSVTSNLKNCKNTVFIYLITVRDNNYYNKIHIEQASEAKRWLQITDFEIASQDEMAFESVPIAVSSRLPGFLSKELLSLTHALFAPYLSEKDLSQARPNVACHTYFTEPCRPELQQNTVFLCRATRSPF